MLSSFVQSEANSIPTAWARGLTQLEIVVPQEVFTERFSKAVSWIRVLLGRLRAPVLERLTLHFESYAAACPPPPAWIGMDSALVKFQERHSPLVHVVIIIASEEYFTFEASKCFPRLHGKGIMEVHRRS
jgi:hypothetical protein